MRGQDYGPKLQNFDQKSHHRKVQVYFSELQNRKSQVLGFGWISFMKRVIHNCNVDDIKRGQGHTWVAGSHWGSSSHAFVSCRRWKVTFTKPEWTVFSRLLLVVIEMCSLEVDWIRAVFSSSLNLLKLEMVI